MNWIRLTSFVLLATCAALRAGEPASVNPVHSDREGLEFFEKKIRPILVETCYECHSVQSGKSKGGLLLDSRDALLAGGSTGPGLVPGKPEESLIIKAVRYADTDFQMPPKRRLPANVVADLEAWVKRGAPDPRTAAPAPATAAKAGITLEEGLKHWAFKPVSDPAVPIVHAPQTARNAIDAFLAEELDKQKLVSVPEADKASLLRRISFDLTGLPPSTQEVESFLADSDPQAFEKAVDRYLASERYGERWGRHWLDLMRYADSNGVDEDVNHPTAWRYRDYVIRAFNSDKPYDQFVHEQLAGDLLGREKDSDALIATAWLSMGPKMLAEPDLEKMKMDIADEQIDIVSKTFLGLTVSCARCHDHKFDPVSTQDYYALAGIFRSVTVISNYGPRPAILMEHPLPVPENETKRTEFKQKVQGAKEAVAAAEKVQPRDAAAEKKLKDLKEALKKLEEKGPELETVMGPKEAEIRDLAVHLRGSHTNLAKEKTPRGMPAIFKATVQPPTLSPKQSGRLELAKWLTDPAHPLTARVMVNRLWQQHFGDGLVRSSSNFGMNGEAPTNPKLLDYLAREFVRGGWSVKRMQKMMLMSAAWRRSSVPSPELAAKDPENRLFGRQNRRRLEAEPIRDTLLAAGGTLDLAMYGTVKGAQKSSGYYGGSETLYQTPRRTIYLPVARHKTYELLSIFDLADTASHTEKRPVTIVPQQALFMMNNLLVRKQAMALAQVVLAQQAETPERLRSAWLRLFSRPALPEELERAKYYLEKFQGGGKTIEAAWTNLIHGLMASNEFVFVD